jgi:O-antigen ligase
VIESTGFLEDGSSPLNVPSIVKRNMNQQPVRPLARLLNQLIYVALLVTIGITAVPYGTVQLWWISIFECLIFLIATLAVVEAMVARRWSLQLSLWIPLFVLCLWGAIQSLPLFSGPAPINPPTSLSADPVGTRGVVLELFALTLAALLLQRYTSSRPRLIKLIYVIVGVGVASAVFGIVRKNMQSSTGFFLPALPTGGRSFAQFINRNHFAFLIEMSLGLTLGLLVAKGSGRRRLAFLPVGILLWIALIYSNSRGGILASLCELLFLGVLLDPVRHLMKREGHTGWRRFQNLAGGLLVRLFLLAGLIGLFAYGVGWVGGEPVVSNFQNAATDFSQQEMQNNANTSRKEIWSGTWEMIRANPLAGVGLGGYWIGITKYHRASGEITPQQAHNDYLELLASVGLLGCALVGWFLVVFIRNVRRRLRSPDPYFRATCLGALAGIFGVAVHSFVDFGLHITINALVLFALIVIAVSDAGDGGAPAISVRSLAK